MTSRQPRVSVILCTYNPRADLLSWALTSVKRQTLPADDFEFVIVDNNSDPPLNPAQFPDGLNFRLMRESRQGVAFARASGFRSTSAPLTVFVDDDNYLDADYLERAIAIADDHPWIGCFGGKARAVLEAPVAAWKKGLLSYLGVRDYGPHAITSTKQSWGEWEPIGAGMVCRRQVADRYVEWMESLPSAAKLGRKGRNLMSGEDTLITHAAYNLSYSCSYQPSLKLSHFIKARRLSLRVLAGTLAGHGRSHVLLLSLRGYAIPRPRVHGMIAELVRRYRRRVSKGGLGVGTIEWFWDLGYLWQARHSGS